MRKALLFLCIGWPSWMLGQTDTAWRIVKAMSIDSLGACQGVSRIGDTYYLYGDRECGMIRSYRRVGDSLVFQGREVRLTVHDSDYINHPTGIAYREGMPVFIGNSIRLNREGTLWKAVIAQVDWPGLLATGTLDGNLRSSIEDDACIQGTRPEYVRYRNRWWVATSDYGPARNEVRLYDPVRLSRARRTSERKVLRYRFSCSPWVQNLHWMDGKGLLVLIQNQIEGRRWRFTVLDLPASISRGSEVVVARYDLDRNDELEGFTLTGEPGEAVGVSSSRRANVNLMRIQINNKAEK